MVGALATTVTAAVPCYCFCHCWHSRKKRLCRNCRQNRFSPQLGRGDLSSSRPWAKPMDAPGTS